jgi:hypothetical protein
LTLTVKTSDPWLGTDPTEGSIDSQEAEVEANRHWTGEPPLFVIVTERSSTPPGNASVVVDRTTFDSGAAGPPPLQDARRIPRMTIA